MFYAEKHTNITLQCGADAYTDYTMYPLGKQKIRQYMSCQRAHENFNSYIGARTLYC